MKKKKQNKNDYMNEKIQKIIDLFDSTVKASDYK